MNPVPGRAYLPFVLPPPPPVIYLGPARLPMPSFNPLPAPPPAPPT